VKKIDKFFKLIKQFISFLLVSGTGWVIDFLGYIVLTYQINLYVMYANILSAIPSITFVFLISTRKIFQNNENGISLRKKYLLYIVYQMFLIISISVLAQIIYNWVSFMIVDSQIFMQKYLKIAIKLGITPITMLLNFIVMKYLSEKI